MRENLSAGWACKCVHCGKIELAPVDPMERNYRPQAGWILVRTFGEHVRDDGEYWFCSSLCVVVELA